MQINIPPPFSGSIGALELINGTLNGAFVSRELKPSDITTFNASKGYPALSIGIGGGSLRSFGFLDGMAVIVHKKNPIESLTLQQLDGIFSTTRYRGGPEINRWKDVGVEDDIGNKEITIKGVTPWNGFENFFRLNVLSVGDQIGQCNNSASFSPFPYHATTRADFGAVGRSGNISDPSYDSDVHWESTVFKIASLVANDTAAIGYTGFAYIDSPVKVIQIQKDDGSAPIAPTYENVALGTWPLHRTFYMNIDRPPGTSIDPLLKEFLSFIVSKQGQQLILDQGIFMPLRKFQQLIAQSLIN